MYLFDTNIFLEFLLRQERATDCKKALESLTSERPGWLTSFSLHGIEAILSTTRAYDILREFLFTLTDSPHIRRYDTTIEEEQMIVRLASKLRLDFDDTVQYYVAKSQGFALVTLDKDFRYLKDIQVLDPAEV